jgi:hypothetical protein
MSEENVVTNVTEPVVPSVTAEVTDDALSAAYDSLFNDDYVEPTQVAPTIVDDVVTPTVEPTVEPPEPLSHEESSRLGRKVADITKQMVTKDDLNMLLQKIETLQQPTPPSFPPVSPSPFTQAEQEEIQDITDVKELDSYLDRREQRKVLEREKQISQYRTGYIKSLQTYAGDLDKETFNEVFQVMKGKYNDVLSGDPGRDCAVNFAQAVKEVAVAKLKKPSGNQFDKNTGVAPITPTIPNTVTNANIAMPQLDPIAAEFVKRVGMSADVVKKTLEGELKTSLTGRKKTF